MVKLSYKNNYYFIKTIMKATTETIYLDHAAATPLTKKAFLKMQPYFSEQFFNPSAPYLPAKHVREAYEEAKATIAHQIGAKSSDLVITAGATESINLAFTARQKKALVLATEHAAVLGAAAGKGGADFSLIKVNQHGVIDLNDLKSQLTDEVDFISVSLANNELGTIEPLAEIAEIIREAKQDRLKRQVETPLFLHSDASQALSLLDINVARLGVDLLTINAAKCGGPKGVGALYVGHGVKLSPIAFGGGQERGLRSGTENVPGVIGFAVAAAEAKEHLNGNRKKYLEMAKVFKQELTQNLADLLEKNPDFLRFLGDSRHQLANFIPVCFNGLDAERLIYKLESQGVLVSTGAACAASKGTKSHVLTAIGLSDSEIAGSLRISLGSTNTLEQIRQAVEIIADAVRHEYSRTEAHK